MDFDPACIDFLEHFDRPKTAEAAGWKHVAEVEQTRADGLTSWDFIDALPQRSQQTRGVGWVLLWAAALTVLVVAASMLAQFGYLIAAENALNAAAQAGAIEATLPRATYHSVAATVQRRLEEQPQLSEHITLTLLQNGMPVIDSLQVHEGDEFSIVLSVPVRTAIPDWLEKTPLWHGQQYINAKAACRLSGRKLPPRTY
jgi:hypothetical protein